jgi:hypothetical protein
LRAVERELAAPLEPDGAAPAGGAGTRPVRDRRGQGFAGVCGELLSSGERVMVVCADVARRREAIERLVAGLGASLGVERDDGPRLALVEWSALAADPALAAPYAHVVAFDPPSDPAERAALDAPARGAGFAHLAWGPAEADFTVRVAEAAYDLRGPLAQLYRGLREAGGRAGGAALRTLLAGEGAWPRPAAVGGRLLRLLGELELGTVSRNGGPPSCTLQPAVARRDLADSPAHRAYARRLDEVRRYVATQLPGPEVVATDLDHAAPPPFAEKHGEPAARAPDLPRIPRPPAAPVIPSPVEQEELQQALL